MSPKELPPRLAREAVVRAGTQRFGCVARSIVIDVHDMSRRARIELARLDDELQPVREEHGMYALIQASQRVNGRRRLLHGDVCILE